MKYTPLLIFLTTLACTQARLVDIKLVADTGATFTFNDAFNLLNESSVDAVTYSSGQIGTEVTISGFFLLGGGSRAQSVTLAGTEALQILSYNNSVVRVRAGARAAGTGDIVITADTGAKAVKRNAFTYLPEGQIVSVFPASGQEGTLVTIAGTNLLGHGSSITSATLAGVPVDEIVSQNNTQVVLRAARSNALVGDIVLNADTRAIVRGVNRWEYLQPGVIQDVTPASGQLGTFVNITGQRLFGGAPSVSRVLLDNVQAWILASANNLIQVRAGQSAPVVNASVTIIGSTGAVVARNSSWTYVAPSQIDTVSPSTGQVGTIVTIRGQRLFGLGSSVVSVTLAGKEVRAIQSQTASTVVVVADHLPRTTGDVVLTSNTGARAVLQNGFSYIEPSVVFDISPNSGQVGTRVVIAGKDLRGGGTSIARVLVAGVQANVVIDLPTLVVIDVRAGSPGTGDVLLVANTGAETRVTNGFTYITPGAIAQVTPNSGRIGTRVNIQGTNLLAGGDYIETVSLATFFATITNATSTSVDVVATSGLPGTGNVVLTANTGAYVTLVNGWTYVPPGTVSSVRPNYGQIGTRVEISGSTLRGGGGAITGVTLAGVPVARIASENDTLVVVEADDGPEGTGDLVLTADSGATLTVRNGWRYIAKSRINTVTPAQGQLGTNVRILGQALFGGGSRINTVLLDGVSATIVSADPNLVDVRAAHAPRSSSPASVVLIADTGATTTKPAAWSYLDAGVISSVSPSQGERNTIVTISGSRLLGGGSRVATVTLAGAQATLVSGNDNTVVVVSNANIPQIGDVVIIADSGATITKANGWEYNAQNDPPVITAVSPVNILEDAAPVFLSVSVFDPDVDELNGTLAFYASAVVGVLSLDNVTFARNVALTTSQDSLNSALRSLSYRVLPDYFGTDTIILRVNDQDFSGLGGSLWDNRNITINIAAVNDRPVLRTSGPNPTLTPIDEDVLDANNPGTLVSDFTNGYITDVDPDPTGVAIVYAESSNGQWQFSTNNGLTWTNIPAAASDTSATLLRSIDRIRFKPSLDYNGQATIRFKAWDQSAGSAGATNVDTTSALPTSSFSIASRVASITVISVNDIPLVDLDTSNPNSMDTSVTFIEDSKGVLLFDPNLLSITDVDHSTLTSFTLTLTNPLDGSKEFVRLNSVLAASLGMSMSVIPTPNKYVLEARAFNPNALPSIANVKRLLLTAEYVNEVDEPNYTTRTIEVVVNDGIDPSPVTVVYVRIQTINDHAPVLSVSPNITPILQEPNTIVALFANPTMNLNLTDKDHNDLFMMHSATLTILNPTSDSASQLLNVTVTEAGVSVSYANRTLTIRGPATVADYQAMLRSAVYINYADEPEPDSRIVEIVVYDSAFYSNSQRVTVQINLINDQVPVVDLNGPTLPGINFDVVFVEQGTPVSIAAPDATVTDADSGPFLMQALWVRITNAADGNLEFLRATASGNVSVTYSPSLHLLTMRGPARPLEFQRVLRTVTYGNDAGLPAGVSSRAITVIAGDGIFNSTVATTNLTIQMINDPPILDLDGNDSPRTDSIVHYVEGDAPVRLGSPNLSLTDEDDTVLASATIRLVNAPDYTSEILRVNTAGTAITARLQHFVNQNRGPGEGKMSSTLTLRLPGVRKIGFDSDPSQENIFTTTVSQLVLARLLPSMSNATVSVSVLNITTSFVGSVEGVDIRFQVIAPDNFLTTLAANITNVVQSGQLLTALKGNSGAYFFLKQSDITFLEFPTTKKFDVIEFYAILTLTGPDTVENFQSVLRTLAYENLIAHPGKPSTLQREAIIVVSDGVDDSIPRTAIITFASVNDAPIVDANGGAPGVDFETSFTEELPPVAVTSPDASIVDVDNVTLAWATVTLLTNPDRGFESLDAVVAGTLITKQYTAATGTLRLSGVDTVANYEKVLRTVKYANPLDEPTSSDRIVQILASDGDQTSVPVHTVIHMIMTNDPPVLKLDASNGPTFGYSTVYTEDQSGVSVVASSVSIQDDDDTHMYEAQLRLLNTPDGAFEQLYVPASFGGSVAGNGTQLLVLTWTAPIAQWLAALRSVQYVNRDDDPDPTVTRVVQIYVTDATVPRQASNVLNTTITVVPVNDAPVFRFNVVNPSFTEGDNPTPLTANMQLFDVDGNVITSAIFRIANVQDFSLVKQTEVLAVDLSMAASLGLFVDYDRDGTLRIIGSSSLPNYAALIRTLTYANYDENPTALPIRVIHGVLSDGVSDSVPDTILLTVIPVNDAPVLTATGSAIFVQGGQPVFAIDTASVYDEERDLLRGARVAVTNPLDSTSEILNLTYASPPATVALTRRAFGLSLSTNQACAERPEFFCTRHSLSFGGTDLVTSLAVSVELDHTYIGDIMMVLEHNGKQVILAERIGATRASRGDCAQANFKRITFIDEASTNVLDACRANIDTTVLPQQPLSAFNGDSSSGNWTLKVFDTYKPFRTGTLRAWSLIISTGARNRTAKSESTLVSPGASYNSALPVSYTGVIVDADVSVFATVYGATEVTLRLVHPDGSSAELVRKLGGFCAFERTGAVLLDDQTSLPATSNDECIDQTLGVYRPRQALSTFNGKVATGTWTLQVSEVRDGQVKLNGWALSLNTRPNVQWSYNSSSNELNLSGLETMDTYTTLLKTITYENRASLPNPANRLLHASVRDADWGNPSPVIVKIHNPALPDLDSAAPGPHSSATFVEKGSAVSIVGPSGMSINFDNLFVLREARIVLTNPFEASEESLASTASSFGPLQASITPTQIVFSGQGTVANYIAAISSITYRHAGRNATIVNRIVQLTLTDTAGLTSVPVWCNITLVPVNDPPEVSLSSLLNYTTSFTENGAAVPIASPSSWSLFDVDSRNLVSMTVTIVNALDVNFESVRINDPKFTGVATTRFVACSDVKINVECLFLMPQFELQITSSSAAARSVQEWEAMFRTALYNNTAAEPNPDRRYIQIVANDGQDTSIPRFTFVDIVLLNENAPVIFSDACECNGQSQPGQVAGFGATCANHDNDPNGPWCFVRSTCPGRLAHASPGLFWKYCNTLTFVEGAGSISLVPGFLLTDEDRNDLFLMSSATIRLTITDPIDRESLNVSIPLGSNVSAQYNTTSRTLLLTGAATTSVYQSIIRTLRYVNSEEEPSPASRRITIVVFDGDQTSNTVTLDVAVRLINDQVPQLSLSGIPGGSIDFSVTFTEEGPAISLVSPQLTLTDADSGNFKLAYATVVLTDGRDGSQETLSATALGEVSVAYDQGTRTLRLTGPAPVLNFQAVLRTVMYANTADEPEAPPARRVDFVVFDGDFNSPTASSYVTIRMINDAPMLDLSGPSTVSRDFAVGYTEGQGAVLLVSPDMTLVDDDNSTLASIRVTLAPRPDGAAETLAANTAGTSISQTFTNSVLVLRGPDTVANFLRVLKTVTYTNALALPGRPTPVLREVTFVVSDGLDNSIEAVTRVSFTSVNDAPILDLSGPNVAGSNYAVNFTEEGPAVPIVSRLDMTLIDVDNDTVSSAEIVLDIIPDGADEELLIDTGSSGIAAVYNRATGRLSLSGVAAVSVYESVLRTARYINRKDEPTPNPRTVRFTVSDGDAVSVPRMTTITFIMVNDPPALSVSRLLIELEEDNSVILMEDPRLSDDDDEYLASARIEILNPLDGPLDRLYVLGDFPVGVTGTNFTNPLLLTGLLTLREWENVLRKVEYATLSQDPNTGPREIVVVVRDPQGAESSPVYLDVRVDSINDQPERTADYPYFSPVVMLEDTPSYNIEILAYHFDRDDILRGSGVRITVRPRFGVATVNPQTGVITYRPDANFNGNDTLKYAVCDSSSLCLESTIDIIVVSVNDVPVARNMSVSTLEDTPFLVWLLNSTFDVEEPNLGRNLFVISFPKHGTIYGAPANQTVPSPTEEESGEGSGDDSGGDATPTTPKPKFGLALPIELEPFTNSVNIFLPELGVVLYAPDPNYNGQDSMVYRVCDSDGACATATVTITIISVNDQPVSISISLETMEDTPVSVDLSLYAEDVEEPSSQLRYSISAAPQHGVAVVVNRTILVYTPSSQYNGYDRFEFRVCDSNNSCSSAPVNVSVGIVNDAPVAQNVTLETMEDTSFSFSLLDFVDDVEDELFGTSITIVRDVTEGTLVYRPTDGIAMYSPKANYFGTDSFVYRVCDSEQLCTQGIIGITIVPRNDLPTAASTNVALEEDTFVVVDILSLVSDVEDTLSGTSIAITIRPQHGSAVVNVNNGSITYTPVPNYFGLDRFTYRVCDLQGGCSQAVVNLFVTNVNDPPVAGNITDSVEEDHSYLALVRSAVVDVDTADVDLVVSIESNVVESGKLVVDPRTGIILYTPRDNFHGKQSFRYKVCDSFRLCDYGWVHLTVISVNDPPVARPLSHTMLTGEVAIFDVLQLVTDVDSEDPSDPAHIVNPLSVEIVSAPTNNIAMSVVSTTDPTRKVVQYVAQDAGTTWGFFGNETMRYRVCDYFGACAENTIKVTVNLLGPRITSVVGRDPDDLDFTFGLYDVIEISFSESTNMPGGSGVLSKAFVDTLVELPGSFRTSADYEGRWETPSLLVLNITKCHVCKCMTCNPERPFDTIPLDIALIFTSSFASFRVKALLSGNIRNADNRSLISVSEGPSFTGNWGKANPQVMTISVDKTNADTSGTETGKTFPKGTRFVITFNGPTNYQACDTLSNSQLNSLLTLQVNPNTQVGQLGEVAGQWLSDLADCPPLDLSEYGILPARRRRAASDLPVYANKLLIVVVNTNEQTIQSAADLKTIIAVKLQAINDELINNYLQSANGSQPFVIDITDPTFFPVVDMSISRGPSIVSIFASDPDNRDEVFSNGDTITVRFDRDTNQPPVSTKADLDKIFSFEQDGTTAVLGADYTGVWFSARVLVITVVDTTGATPPRIGAFKMRLRTKSIQIAGVTNSENTVTASSALEGDFGRLDTVGALYYLLPVIVFALTVMFAVYALYKQKHPYSKKDITKAVLPSGQEQPWSRPPAMKSMRANPDPFLNMPDIVDDRFDSKKGGETAGVLKAKEAAVFGGSKPAATVTPAAPFMPRAPSSIAPPLNGEGALGEGDGAEDDGTGQNNRALIKRESQNSLDAMRRPQNKKTSLPKLNTQGTLPPLRGQSDPFKAAGPVFLPPLQRQPGSGLQGFPPARRPSQDNLANMTRPGLNGPSQGSITRPAFPTAAGKLPSLRPPNPKTPGSNENN